MAKKIICFLLSCTLLLALGSCKRGDDNENDGDGDMLAAPSYSPDVLWVGIEMPSEFIEGLAAVYDENWGYIDTAGKRVTPFAFEYAGPFSNGVAVIAVMFPGEADEEVPLYGLIDNSGEIVAELEYHYFGEFSDGLAVVGIEGIYGAEEGTFDEFGYLEGFSGEHGYRYGYIDRAGKLVIPLQFREAHDFAEGLAPVADEQGLYGYINSAGEIVITPKYQYAFGFSEGLGLVVADGKSGFVNATGGVAISFDYEVAGSFSGGLAVAAKLFDSGVKYGYIDKTGYAAIPYQYQDASDFRDGVARVLEFGETDYSYIDRTGNVIARGADYIELHDFSEGLAAVRSLEERSWGFIDNSGSIVIPCIYEWVGESGFSNGLALVKDNNKWGFIDKSGNVAVRIDFDALYEFVGDYAIAVIDRKFGIIDKSGYEVIPCQYEFIGYIGYGRAFIREGENWGIIEISR